MLELFKVEWILIGCQSFYHSSAGEKKSNNIKEITIILFLCAVVVSCAVESAFLLYRRVISPLFIFLIFILTVLDVNVPLAEKDTGIEDCNSWNNSLAIILGTTVCQ